MKRNAFLGVEIEMNPTPTIESSAIRVEEPLQAEVPAIPPAEAEQARRWRQIANLEDSALIRHLAQNPSDWNDNLRLSLAEQAEKIGERWLIDEHDLWRELENVSAKGFERRVS